jgi:RNA polymerase sigma-70 factor (ECF subfamily)
LPITPELKNISDIELINFVRNGDNAAFTKIVGRYEKKIAATIIGMIGKCDEADDIGQEVFIRFYKSINNFRGESALGTYLTRIAINLSLNEIRRRRIKRFFSFEEMLESGKDVGGDVELHDEKEKSEIVLNAVQELPAKYRSVVVLRLIEGCSTEETAGILNLPLGTVLSRHARGQQKLREILKPYISIL